MDDEIEKYLNDPIVNPKRLKFIPLYKSICEKRYNGNRLQCRSVELRFLYIVKMVMKHREIQESNDKIKSKSKSKNHPYKIPLKRIKFELKDLNPFL